MAAMHVILIKTIYLSIYLSIFAMIFHTPSTEDSHQKDSIVDTNSVILSAGLEQNGAAPQHRFT